MKQVSPGHLYLLLVFWGCFHVSEARCAPCNCIGVEVQQQLLARTLWYALHDVLFRRTQSPQLFLSCQVLQRGTHR